jgi:hypothetical protein
MTFRSAFALMVVLLAARTAGAQQIASSLAELKVLQSTDSRVTVTDTKGQEFRGTVVDASPAQLSLRIGSATRQFAAADVRSVRVRKEDSLGNGALIGLAVGGGLASLIFLDNECHDDPECYTIVAVDAGIGALMGLGIDALIHRHVTVYTAPASGVRPALTVGPLIARGRTGVRLTFAF